MYTINFQKPEHIHFIGIGGISMSGLAEVLLQRGFTVSGSDASESALTKKLADQGAKIFIGQKASNIQSGIDAVVYTAAIHEDNPEYAECVKQGIPMMTRAQLLGQLMKNYELPIAVSGTHGKTTTTSLLSEILVAMETDPTLSVGGMLKSIGGNIRIGSSEIFVTEACEYTNSFLSFFPKIAIILNIDADHLDFFKDLVHIRESFKKFANLLPPDGLLLLQADIPDIGEIVKDISCPYLTFGIADKEAQESEGADLPDIYATDIEYDESGHPSFVFHMKDKEVTEFKVSLSVVGRHNVSNALSCIALALIIGGAAGPDNLGIAKTDDKDKLIDTIIRAADGFTGTDRRFEYKGTIGNVTIIDDYAHHPTEIEATLRAAEKYPHKNLRVVFQPHTYSRTKSLLHDFARALSLADEVILADIYAARETDTLGISSRTLMAELEKLGCPTQYFPTFDEIESYILKKCTPGDLLITMGAGDVYKIGEKLLGK